MMVFVPFSIYTTPQYQSLGLVWSEDPPFVLEGHDTHTTTTVMDTYNEVEKALGTTVEDFDAADLEEELKELLSSPGGPSGGTPGKEERKHPTPANKARKALERDFVFDCEERMLAELNDLDVEEGSPGTRSKKVPVAEAEAVAVPPSTPERNNSPKSSKPSKAWYPPSGEFSRSKPWTNNNNECTLADIAGGFGELRLDERLHPGQKLNMDFTTPPRLYSTDFQVRDHKLSGGVWLYNTRDKNSNIDSDLGQSTEYFSSESPGKSAAGVAFQMAPGGERRKSTQESWPQGSDVEDLERRLKNLRGFDI
ncbi:unnamed protein product [Arctia plantaginis]|uniref:Uncharacterized protein n=1 Tax=Arctia plantaginis TaxID=874455 RepID=A0A8S0YUC1_ARCPL|nr:unnamed protein product [Arctia plantaginis]